ncbi:MAG: LuxR C-terminal-related transcriptional regulator [Coriobacteriia bacterium]|nr:LuxR C-terminal-related transcriptional regulator [Coriobacteriia bacterium]
MLAENSKNAAQPDNASSHDPLQNEAITILCLAWFALLVSTPFFIEAHRLPSVFSSAYAFIALGILAGAICAMLAKQKLPSAVLPKAKPVILLAGLVITTILVVPEWYFHLRAFAGSALSMEEIAPYVPLMVTFADIQAAPFGNLSSLHHLLFFTAGLCFATATTLQFKIPSPESPSNSSDPTNQKQQIKLIAGLFTCGVLHPGVWGWLAHTYGTDWDEAVMHDLLGFMGSSIFAIAIGIGLAFILYWSNKKLSVQASALLASFALGELAWNLIARCGNANENIVLVAPWAALLLMALEALLVYSIFHAKDLTNYESNPAEGPQEQTTHASKKELLDTRKLTERERQSVELALQGKTSGESAEIIGVAASTVRTYLRRACQKLEIESIDELQGNGKADDGAKTPSDSSESKRSSTSEGVELPSAGATNPQKHKEISLSLILLVLLGAAFLLPHQYVGTVASWNSSHSVVIGCGLGLMMAGGLLALTQRVCSNWLVPKRSQMFCLAALFLSGTALTFLQYAFTHEFNLASQSMLLFLIAVAGIAFGLSLGLSTKIKNEGLAGNRKLNKVLCLVALILVAVSYLSDTCWVALSEFSLVAYCLFKAFGALKSKSLEAGAGAAPLPKMEACLFVLAAFPFGVITGELWRGLQNPLLLAVYVIFLAATLVLYASHNREKDRASVTSFVCLDILTAIAIAAGIPHALLILCALALLKGRAPTCAQAFMVIGIGTGLSLGRLGFDTWRDILGASFTTTESFGANVASAAAGPALMIVITMLGLASFSYLVSLYKSEGDLGFSLDKEERDILLLRSKGVNELEALVLAKIAQGKTGPQIARELHYSLGTINGLRSHAYQAINVHSKQELVERGW